VDGAEPGLWRYAAALPDIDPGHRPRLGEVVTPLVATGCLGAACELKLDHLMPTGSYKDRGAAVLVGLLRQAGVPEILEDSSGNAGAAIAAYAARAGMGCTIYSPAGNSPAKLAQVRAYGAELVTVEGDRAATAEAALAAAGRTFYASHNRHPAFVAGVSTLGFELWEQGGFSLPDHVVVPVGYGSLVLGLDRAFGALAGPRPPRIHAVQSEAYPAIARALEAGAADVEAAGGGPTLAEGIASRRPVRGPAVLRALRASGGGAVTVSDGEVAGALRTLARVGFLVEPTSAAAAAGFVRLVRSGRIAPGERAVVLLTGSGLKAGQRIAELLAAGALDNES
jgi:threonine synthase